MSGNFGAWERRRRLLWRRHLLVILTSVGTGVVATVALVNLDSPERSNQNETVASTPTPDGPRNKDPSTCVSSADGSYGETPAGQWLRGLLIEIGVPGVSRLESQDIVDTGTALEVLPEEYSDRLGVYVIAQKPPDPDFSPASRDVIDQIRDVTLYYNDGRPQRSFTAHSEEWQLSIIAYPAPGKVVSWDPNTRTVTSWFSEALSRAEKNPPPCS